MLISLLERILALSIRIGEEAQKNSESFNQQLKQLEKIMSTTFDAKAFIAELNAETDTLAAKIDALLAKLGSGVSLDQSDIDGFTAVSSRLKALGADPADPIPTPVDPTL